jgi:hypothetical protein
MQQGGLCLQQHSAIPPAVSLRLYLRIRFFFPANPPNLNFASVGRVPLFRFDVTTAFIRSVWN